MGEKDHRQKLLEDYEDVFADIVNVLAFHGEALLKEQNIVPAPTESIYKNETGETRQQLRDIIKYDKVGKTTFSVIGLENQSTVDQDMVFRVMSYDAASYRQQISAGETGRHPVFTMVLYFGTEPWTAPRSILEALEKERTPYGKYIPELVTDGRLNVIEVAYLPEEVRRQFRSDFRIIADFFYAKRAGKEREFLEDRRTFKHVEEMLDFLSIFTKDNRYQEYKAKVMEDQKRGGAISMCTLLDYVEEQGMEKGLEQGIEKGLEQGIEQGIEKGIEKGILAMISTLREIGWPEDQILRKIQEKFQLDEERARMYL